MHGTRELVLKRTACVWANHIIRVECTLPTSVHFPEDGIVAYINGFARKMFSGETLDIRPNITVELQNVKCEDVVLEFNSTMTLINQGIVK